MPPPPLTAAAGTGPDGKNFLCFCHHASKAYGEWRHLQAKLYIFLTMVLGAGDRSASRPDHFIPEI